MRYAPRMLTFAAGVALAAACASSKSAEPSGPSATPANIVMVSGDSQSGQYEQPTPKPLIVKVTDASGNAVSNASVAWALTLTGASLSQQISTTNATGETQISPTLGGLPGPYTIAAAINNHSVTFTGSSNAALASGLQNLTGGLFSSCGLSTSGSAFCWGSGIWGGLGNGDTVPVAGAVPVSGGYQFTQISAGTYYTCGITTAGKLYCWGNDGYGGQMGDGNPPSGNLIPIPQPAGNGMTFTQVSVGDDQSCGISAGVTYCWGAGNHGALGNGDTVNHYTPVAVSLPGGVSGFASLASGWGFTCALTSAGAAYCWGTNANGYLGIGSSSTAYSDVPVAVAGGHTFTMLAAGTQSVCGLTSAGTVYCWGQDTNGNNTSGVEWSPAAVQQSGLTFTTLSMKGVHACALTAAGAAYCWGDNSGGALGTGSFTSTGATPAAVTGGYTFSTVFAVGISTCGYTTSKTMYCWGSNQSQELGLPATADSMYAAPQPVPGLGTP